MNILITGANGFMGKNLQTILRDQAGGQGFSLWLADVDTSPQDLAQACAQADFVFHLAGVNRPKEEAEFQQGNVDFTRALLAQLSAGRRPPVLLTSSTQAALDHPYGRSKKDAEEALRAYGKQTGSPVYVYRLTNAFGKWSRPNYNSAVATFCHNISRGLPIQINDPSVILRLNYIDDIIAEFLRAMDGSPTRQGDFCAVLPEHSISLGAVAELLYHFHASREQLDLVDQSEPFVRKLYATYLSFLPTEDFARSTKVKADARGSFAELLHMDGYGQISLNVILPHITKGDHWHQTKHEKFIVMAGEGVIRFRRADGDGDILSYAVCGDLPTLVDIPPGYTHNIENTGNNPMYTLMWANERFDPYHPDTFSLPVQPPTKENS